jgi:hypothetical protein
MIHVLTNVPPNVAAFRASGDVGKTDYKEVLIPHVDRLVTTHGKINFLFVLDNNITDFSLAALLEDLKVGIKHFSKWHKMAIVSSSKGINTFTDIFSYIAPGEAKGFAHTDIDKAIEWVSK